jgi:alkane 1-monooxygenase
MADVALDAPAPTTVLAWRDNKLFLWILTLFVPLLLLLGWSLTKQYGEGWWWIAPAIVFVIIPILDFLASDDDGNVPEELVPALEAKPFYRWVSFGYLPLMAGGAVLCGRLWSTQPLGLTGRLGMVFALGTVTGIGIANAHELGHKREVLHRIRPLLRRAQPGTPRASGHPAGPGERPAG